MTTTIRDSDFWTSAIDDNASAVYDNYSDDDNAIRNEQRQRDLDLISREGNQLDLNSLFDSGMVTTITEFAETVPIPADGITLMILPVVASILGRNHKFHMFHDYYEKPILQMVLQVRAGMRKSLTLDTVTKPLELLDRQDDEAYTQKVEGMESKDAKNVKPPRERVMGLSTTEGLVTSSWNKSNGFLRKVDEFPRLINTLDAYKSGGGGKIGGIGISQELLIWDGSTLKMTMVNGTRRVYDPRVSTIGTVQPKKLLELIDRLGGLDDSDSDSGVDTFLSVLQ